LWHGHSIGDARPHSCRSIAGFRKWFVGWIV